MKKTISFNTFIKLLDNMCEHIIGVSDCFYNFAHFDLYISGYVNCLFDIYNVSGIDMLQIRREIFALLKVDDVKPFDVVVDISDFIKEDLYGYFTKPESLRKFDLYKNYSDGGTQNGTAEDLPFL